MRNQYTFAFDQDEEDKMLFDEAGKTGLKTATSMINNEISETLRINLAGKGLDSTAFSESNAILKEFYLKNLFKGEHKAIQTGSSPNLMEMTGPGLSIIRACSEALLFGVVTCLKNDSSAREVIRNNFNSSTMHIKTPTKLLMCVFTGGKASGSLVKFSKFYLVIDGFANPDTNIPNAFTKFMNALKKNMSTVKGGDAAFKLGPEGSYFNAFSSIAETFKQFEDAIA